MRDYFLTQRKLGCLFFFSVFSQVAWWGAVIYTHRSSIDLMWAYESWIDATILGKVLGIVFLLGMPATYLYTLCGLWWASWKLLTMSDWDFALLRALQPTNWKRSALSNLVPPFMVVLTLILFGTALEGAPEAPASSGPMFGVLCFAICYGYTALPLSYFQSAEYERKESHIDHMIVFS